MSLLCVVLFAISLCVYPAMSQRLQSCDDVNKIFPGAFSLQDGSSLSRCTFHGQQCCSPVIVNFVDQGFRALVQSDQFNFTSGLAGAQTAIDQMRDRTDEIVKDIIDDVLKPLLLSTVDSPPPSSFVSTINSVINDINTVLDGKHVDLKVSIANYFKAVALFYVDDVIDLLPFNIRLSTRQKECASNLVFNHIYDNTESAAELIDLMQNISVAVAVIKQLPPIFDELLQDFIKFRFSDTCLDVFTANYLCPVCRNQPFMCPGRCAEIVTGCVSPLHQPVVQLDTSLKLILSIVKSLIGTPDSVTDAVTISRISVLYNDLLRTLKTFDFLTASFIWQVIGDCNIFRFGFGKRSLDEIPVVTKRALEIPDVGINETFLRTLEEQFSSLGGDKIADATESFCSPDFSVEFLPGLKFHVTQPNGRCSYGVCNVGHYNSIFKKKDIADQCFNPAGQFDYDQLISQAKNQTYVLTELFSTTAIPESIFKVFLPNETFPSTKFLDAAAPAKPTIIPTTTCMPKTSSKPTPVTTSSIIPTPTTPAGPCPAGIIGKVGYNKNKKRARLTYTVDNPDATVECELDDQGRKPCKDRMQWRNLALGRHTVTVYVTCVTADNITKVTVKPFNFRVRQ